jgi:predicted SnoaL-like aldol condensation-catalyzing enzyme
MTFRSGLGFVFALALLSACAVSPAQAETTEDLEIATAPAWDPASFVVSAYDKVLNQLDTHALDTMFADNFVQHNSSVADGRAGLAALIEFRKTQQPEAHNEIVRVIAEGDLVALHVHVTTTAAERGDPHAGVAILDIFRVADHKIVEHWDVIQPVPPTSVNGHTMFDGGGTAPVLGSPREARRNAALVVNAYDKILNQLDTSPLATAFGDTYTQHNPTIPDGTAGLAALVAFRKAQQPDAHNEIERVIAQGDLVLLHVHVTTTAAQRGDEHAGFAITDIFRVADGKIVEHWDVIQPVPPTSVNGHTMFDGGGRSLDPQCHDRIHARGADGGVHPEADPEHPRGQEGEQVDAQ